MKAKVNPVYVSRMEVKNHPIPSDLFGLVEKSFGALFFQRGAEVVERGADGLSFVVLLQLAKKDKTLDFNF